MSRTACGLYSLLQFKCPWNPNPKPRTFTGKTQTCSFQFSRNMLPETSYLKVKHPESINHPEYIFFCRALLPVVEVMQYNTDSTTKSPDIIPMWFILKQHVHILSLEDVLIPFIFLFIFTKQRYSLFGHVTKIITTSASISCTGAS